MANKKFSQLTALTTPASADLIAIVDDSEASVEKTKKITFANLQTAILTAASELISIIGSTGQVRVTDGTFEPITDDDIDLGTSAKQFKYVVCKQGLYVNLIAQGKDVTAALHRKIVEIGDWNMDGIHYVTVAHGLSDYSKVRSIRGMIRGDSDATAKLYPISPSYAYDLSAPIGVSIQYIDSTVVYLVRQTSSVFDATSFNQTSYNRGWLIIEYVD